ncbi:MAG TPA: flagellar basal-body MS-ring/collar protein FliF [Rhodocyclaceae bacterium]|nr:flagellar basal-body MS-ring/collar protein FliF [Rhodocyclaceae bacterium]
MASADQATAQDAAQETAPKQGRFNLPPAVTEALNKTTPQQRLLGAIGIALLIAIAVSAWLWSRDPAYSVLFSNLTDRDGGEIVTVLQQQNIPYKVSDSGTAILVPASVVNDTRLKLASQGMPRGGLVGFELMENQKMGISQFAEQINYQRGLEGELSRSIQSIDVIKAARVHLAIPKQTAFLRDEQKPTASVLVTLYPGRVLEPNQIAGIVHLISSSVPQLSADDVSVVDQDGNLISQKRDALEEAGLDPSQLKYVRAVEASYIKRIEEIVGTVVGSSNVKARVAADIDFSQSEQVAETYRPNPTPDTAIRSQQTSETGTVTPGPVGVPGALTNQPPVPATAPLTTPPVAGAAGATGTNASGQSTTPENFTKNATINYELDKTVRHTKDVPGAVRRLSVAVVINYKQDAKGKDAPLPSEELKQVTDLVREAMGYNQQRGDTLNVANISFSPTQQESTIPLWKDPENIALGRDLLKYVVLAVIAFIIWWKLVKPIVDRMTESNRVEPSGEIEGSAGSGEMFTEDEQEIARLSFEKKLEHARELAKADPKLVAEMLKEWMGANE